MTDRKRITDTSSNVEMDSYSQNYNADFKPPKKKVYKSKIFIIAVTFSATLLVVMTIGFVIHHKINANHPINGLMDEARSLVMDLPMEQQKWYEQGTVELQKALNRKRNKRRAKNVILFVGDGMGPNTVTAARIMGFSEEGLMSWEEFPDMGLLKVRIFLNNIK